jgi:hypothetical protein
MRKSGGKRIRNRKGKENSVSEEKAFDDKAENYNYYVT